MKIQQGAQKGGGWEEKENKSIFLSDLIKLLLLLLPLSIIEAYGIGNENVSIYHKSLKRSSIKNEMGIMKKEIFRDVSTKNLWINR